MRFLCLPGQALAGRPAELLTPRRSISLAGPGGLESSIGSIRTPLGRKISAGRAGPQGECALDRGGDVLACSSPSPTASLGLDQVFSVNLWVYLHSRPYGFELSFFWGR